MPLANFIKDITSKDINLSKYTITKMLKSSDSAYFEELCKKSDFIFPHIKQRIIDNFVKLVNKDDIEKIFTFSKIHNCDFEDMIVKAWVKFADEDLTDEILELFENGTKEQKTHAAKYFSSIQDSLALEYLKKYAMSEFLPLKINCARSLSAFKDTEMLSRAKEIVFNSTDDFETLSAFEFINAYGGDEQVKFICENAFLSPFSINIISNLMDFNDFNSLKKSLDNKTLMRIFNLLIEGYPEDIPLDTISYYQIYDFIELINDIKSSYSNNLLLLAKAKFKEFENNEIYSFDLDKNLKTELKNITKKLNSLDLSFENIQEELNCYSSEPYRFSLALDIISEYKIDKSDVLADLINQNKLADEFLAKTASVLYGLQKICLIDKKVVSEIKNENIKALIESYFTS